MKRRIFLVCIFYCFFRLPIYESIAAIFWQSASYVKCFTMIFCKGKFFQNLSNQFCYWGGTYKKNKLCLFQVFKLCVITVRLNLNERKSGDKRTKVLKWNPVKSRKSDERPWVWLWMHGILVNARKESLNLNSQKSNERTKVWTWAHENLANARKYGQKILSVWNGPDIETFHLRRSGHT